jgi:hypothetical protein
MPKDGIETQIKLRQDDNGYPVVVIELKMSWMLLTKLAATIKWLKVAGSMATVKESDKSQA